MYVVLNFPDAEARYASRIQSVTLSPAPPEVDDDIEILLEIPAGALLSPRPTTIDVPEP